MLKKAHKICQGTSLLPSFPPFCQNISSMCHNDGQIAFNVLKINTIIIQFIMPLPPLHAFSGVPAL